MLKVRNNQNRRRKTDTRIVAQLTTLRKFCNPRGGRGARRDQKPGAKRRALRFPPIPRNPLDPLPSAYYSWISLSQSKKGKTSFTRVRIMANKLMGPRAVIDIGDQARQYVVGRSTETVRASNRSVDQWLCREPPGLLPPIPHQEASPLTKSVFNNINMPCQQSTPLPNTERVIMYEIDPISAGDAPKYLTRGMYFHSLFIRLLVNVLAQAGNSKMLPYLSSF